MLIYFAKRFTWLIFIVFCAITVTFVLSRMIPACPASLAAGLDAGPEAVARLREQMGLDLPLHIQYINYLRDVITLDFGFALQTRRPVIMDIGRNFPATLELVLLSFSIYLFLGILLGVIWAAWPRGFLSRFLSTFTSAGVATPLFWSGLLLQMIFAGQLRWLPTAGRLPQGVTPPSSVTGLYTVDSLLAGDFALFLTALTYLILPVTALVFNKMAIASRLTYSTVTTELEKDYVRTARAKGVSESAILIRHVLKNALNPVISMVGLQFGWLIAGTILVEVVFSFPGLGLYLFNAFRTFDYNPIMAVTIIVTIVFVVVNTIVDLIYPILDPRVGVK